MKSVFAGASSIFAVVPGIAVISSGAFAPPDHTRLFGLIIEIVGIMTLLLVILNRRKLAKTKISTTHWAIRSGVFSLVCLLAYFAAFDFCIVNVEQRGVSYFPLYTTGFLGERIDALGSRSAVVDAYGEAGVYEMILKQPWLLRISTTFILLILISATVVGLVFSFGILASRLYLDRTRI